MADGRRVLVPHVHAHRHVRERGQGPGRAAPGPADFGRWGSVPAGDPALLLLLRSPFLPATHAITALRASIAGYAGHEYADAMWFLASFILFAAFLGLALRPLLVRGNRRMVAKLESTKLL